MPPSISQDELRVAFHLLFGPSRNFSLNCLSRMAHEDLKGAFRRRALETHPDRSAALGIDQATLHRQFQTVQEAYQALSFFVRERPIPRHSRRGEGQDSRETREVRRPGSAKGPGKRRDKPEGSGRRKKGSPKEGLAEEGGTGGYWTSGLPPQELPLGQFLYYSRMISWRVLVEAITWQRIQRPHFGQIARSWNLVGPEEISLLLSHRFPGERMGDTAVRLGLLTPYQKMSILGMQKWIQRPLGEFFMEKGILDPVGLKKVLRAQRLHNRGSGHRRV